MDLKPTQTGTHDHLGITFGDIHSDEPHEAVNASKTEVVQKHSPTPTSHLSGSDVFNVAKGLESGHIEAGTIVSDKKDSRPSLGNNIASAFTEWWGSTKKTFDTSAEKMQAPLIIKKEGPVVSKVETRVDVVKTAATHATMAPKDDHHVLVQKIRTFKQDVARVQNTPLIVKEQSEQKSRWTHTDQKPAEPAKKVQLETYVASVAVEQKQIPTPPQKLIPHIPALVPSTPKSIPPPPSVHIPKPPKKVIVVEKQIASPNTSVTELKRNATPAPNTPRMNVPDTVVKRDSSLPKKNIWVAPRIQPESSVLAPHNTPTPVSQSFIPTQNPLPPKAPTAVTPSVPVATPAPIVVPKTEVLTPVPTIPTIASGVTPQHGSMEPFHSTRPVAQVETPNIEVPKPAPAPVPSVPQPIITKTISVAQPVLRPAPSPAPEVVVLKETPKPTLASIPQSRDVTPSIPKPMVPNETQSFISNTPPQRVTPPQVHKSALYKPTPIETSVPVSMTSKEPAHTPLQAPTPLVQKYPVSPLQEIPKRIEVEKGGYANLTPVVEQKSFATIAPQETPRVASVPLPRAVPIIPEQPRVEVRPVVQERNIPEPVKETSAPLIPRTPAPTPSRPVPMPPLERVISTPVSEQVVTPAPTNKAYRTFVRWAVIVLIILTGIALALFASIYFNVFKKDSPAEQTPITVPTFIETTTQTPLMIEGTKETFLSALKENVTKAGSGLTQFYPTVQEGETTRPGSSAEILNFLNTHLDERTKKSLNPTIMMGSISTSKNEPFIVLQSSNFDVLFTGLLAWEPNLYTDFAPLFGDATPSKIKFKDAVRDNTSTRILYDDAGNEILLYSFINQKTVVITTSGEALSELIKQF